MTRFVRLFRYDPVKDPTARLRFDYDPEFGNAILADEDTLPEHVDNPDARRVETLHALQLTTAEVRWLATTAAELVAIMERCDAELQRELDGLHPYRRDQATGIGHCLDCGSDDADDGLHVTPPLSKRGT